MDNTGIMLPLGLVLRDRYRIEEYLSSGGFGNTYRVHDVHLDEDFALKEFFCRTINSRNRSTQYVTVSNPGNMADFQSLHKKFRKEALRIRSLSGDHIVKVYDLFEEFGTSYYVMDFIDGESLQTLVKRRGPLPEAEVLGYLEQMLDGLDEIHRESIWHLDIKPGNMMLDKKGRLRLIDFGASKLVDLSSGAMTSSMAMAYTPGYAPIEQTEQKLEAIGAHTDLYAIGATLYNLLTGERPPSTVDLITSPADAFNYLPGVSRTMIGLVTWLMQLRGENRPQNVAQVRDFLAKHTFDEPYQPAADVATVIPTVASSLGQSPNPSPGLDIKKIKTHSKNYIKIICAYASIVAIGITILVWRNCMQNSPRQTNTDVIANVDNDSAVKTFEANGVKFNMVAVEGGAFTMGATVEQGDDARDEEKPAHQVTLSSFSIGQTEVTQELWQAVMGNNPSEFKGDLLRPVEQVSWDDCQVFITKLNQLTGQNFRLPTEAEWEYAARGGHKSKGFKYSGSNTLGDVAWYGLNDDGSAGNSNYQTHPVGTKTPNELGLYDMSGNVLEWCQDWYGDYSTNAQTNPTGPSSGSYRVYRGGGRLDDARSCRVSRRSDDELPSLEGYGLGLRLAL